MSATELSDKQKRFVDEYLIDNNATQACIRSGYSKKNADKIASQLLGNTRVADAIEAKRRRLQIKTEITIEKVLNEYAKIGFCNMADYADWSEGGVIIKDKAALTRDQMAAISEISETKSKGETTVKIKLHDKKGSLDSIAKHLGMFIERKQITGADGGAIKIENSDIDLSALTTDELALFRSITEKLSKNSGNDETSDPRAD